MVDSRSLRAADTVGADGQGRDGGKKVAGRKGHVAVDCPGLLLVVLVTAASVQDRDATWRRMRTAKRPDQCASSPDSGVSAGTSAYEVADRT
ncbi:hypothetical protein GCM10010094_49800 [Streptomyces flaveus]|uniref:Transposase IS4-like domain-containing protein n=2 Tax=Streptomyces flaveus TaxID=66370 RepID=A0A917R139_9ACTN|nr:hypothetical protein GCM10010094_49800 [Streptomyces flaveus]